MAADLHDHTLTFEEDILALAAGKSFYCRVDRTCLRVFGSDHVRYLHNRLTQDIKGLQSGHAAHSLLLSPQGKTQGAMLLWRTGEEIYLLPDDSDEARFLAVLLQFRVADRVEVESQPRTLFLCFGINVRRDLGRVIPDELLPDDALLWTTIQHTQFAATAIALPSVGPYKLFGFIAPSDVTLAWGDIAPASSLVWDALRIASCRPRFGIDLNEKTSAADLPLDEFVSFTKGCYTGQEVVEMATARGRPNRRLVVLEAEGELVPGGSLSLEGKPVGSVTSSVFFSRRRRSLALGFVKSEVGDDAKLSAPQPVRIVAPGAFSLSAE